MDQVQKWISAGGNGRGEQASHIEEAAEDQDGNHILKGLMDRLSKHAGERELPHEEKSGSYLDQEMDVPERDE